MSYGFTLPATKGPLSERHCGAKHDGYGNTAQPIKKGKS